MKRTRPFTCLLATAVLFSFISIGAAAQVITTVEIDSLVTSTMKAFDVPGIAVAVIKDGKILHMKGYGVRSLNTMQKVDENTLFGIASNSKAFTSAALGILVDEKKISWDDKVIDYIPEFRLYDPYVTDQFTIRDLLTHRSGMGLGAGDLMIFPGPNDFSKSDIIHNLRYLKPVSSFRTKFDYDNLLYIIAGEVIARVSGSSWEDFIETRIMKPLNMTASAGSYMRIKDKLNVIDAHARVNGKVQVIDRDLVDVADAAGGIYSNLSDMSKWLIMQMNKGKYGEKNEKRLFSQAVQHDMWSMQTILPVNDTSIYNTHFSGYGLGWFLSDVRGYKQVTHTGGLAGIVTEVTMIPEMKLGILVFTNQESGAAFRTITTTILDSYFGIKGINRLKQNYGAVQMSLAYEKSIMDKVNSDIDAQQKSSSGSTADSLYTGVYTDKWFGDISISVKDRGLWFDSKKSSKLTGKLTAYKGNTFVVRWNDRSMNADAYVMFNLDNNGKAISIKMKAISPLTDFSYDFQDLDLVKKK